MEARRSYTRNERGLLVPAGGGRSKDFRGEEKPVDRRKNSKLALERARFERENDPLRGVILIMRVYRGAL